jgi:phosphate transport system permease protein
MKPRSLARRRLADRAVKAASAGAAAIGLAALAWILCEVAARGAGALNWAFFTELPTPPGMEGGGLANAIAGTGLITGMAVLMGIPTGLLAGVYLAEFGQNSRIAGLVRFVSSTLMGVPSIIIGVFVYTLLVIPTGHFSGYAGAVALGIIMLPIVARTTEDILRLVPAELRESALALGAPRWKITLGIVFKAARGGLLTGVILAIARVSGETAPLLFTALNSPYWMQSPAEPTGNLTVTIFNYAMSPYADWQEMAWGASLLITAGILIMTVCARLAAGMGKRKNG